MSDDINNKNNINDNTADKADILELTDAFLSLMDEFEEDKKTIIAEKNKHTSPIKDILPDFTAPYDADSVNLNDDNVLDENRLSEDFIADELVSDDERISYDPLYEEKSEVLSENREKRIFYASLYLSGKPIELSTFRKMLAPINLENRLISYAEEFNNLRIGVRIRMVSGGYQIVTDSDVSGFLEKYFGERTEALSRAALETVAIIAYRQPITKAEVEEMREVNSSGTMRNLLDKNLIKVVGRKQVPGKPLLYATTKYFLEYFGLNDISELPTFREWQELKQNQ